MDPMKGMEYHAQNANHRELLRGQAEMQAALAKMAVAQADSLKAIEGMRTDMREMMTDSRKESRTEAKELRERYDNQVEDLHARINETDRIARATATQMSAITWGLRGAWGAIAVGVIGFLVSIATGGNG